MTNDPMRRLKQHNREISGGARATQGRNWHHVMIVSGFPTKRDALQFEWYWKYISKRRGGIISKMTMFLEIWKRGYSSSSSTHFCDFSNPIFLSFSALGLEKAEKIEALQCLINKYRAPNYFLISNYSTLQLFPFQAIPFQVTKMSSTISNTIVDGEAAALKEKKPRKPKTVAPESAAAPAADVESKPKKAPKVKTDGEAPKEKKPRKPKVASAAAPGSDDDDDAPLPVRAAATTAAPEPLAALPGSSVALAASDGHAAPLQRTDANMESEAETTDAEASGAEASGAAAKEKKPRKPRAKKATTAAEPAASNTELDSLDDSGKIAYLMAQVAVLRRQLDAVLAGREADAASTTSGEKKPRKKREPKVKAVCPVAKEGVIRFHSTLKNDYKPLSNSHKTDITIDGVVYPTVEHYYQCAKFLETAPDYAEKIRTTANPALIKNMGRTKKVEGRADWDDVQLDVMRTALRAKFAQHEELADLLRGTGAARLEEESPSDAYWGIGADGAGENHLGVLLAEVRASL